MVVIKKVYNYYKDKAFRFAVGMASKIYHNYREFIYTPIPGAVVMKIYRNKGDEIPSKMLMWHKDKSTVKKAYITELKPTITSVEVYGIMYDLKR